MSMMISNIMGLPDEEEEQQPMMFSDLRKKLVNEFTTELSDFADNYEHLKVYLRVRPFTSEEILNNNNRSCLHIEDETSVIATAPKDSNTYKNSTHMGNRTAQKFKFSKVFAEDTEQSAFYDGTVNSLVKDFLDGQNCLVFAYGVTNAGKTYTVQGNQKNPGILPRTLESIFSHISGKQWHGLDLKPKMYLDVIKLSPRSESEERRKKDELLLMASFDDCDIPSILVDSGRESGPMNLQERSQDSYLSDTDLLHSTQLNDTAFGDMIKYSVWVSFAEVYNEQVFDLFEVANQKKRTLLKLGEDRHGNPYIRGLTEVNVSSIGEVQKLLTVGQKNLRKACTKLNHSSSRSHCIFNIKLLRVVNRQNPSVAKVSMLSLCDLAGSERTCKTNSTGDRLKEAGNINTSLMTLGRCIEIMRTNQIKKDLPKMIPYRDSKLTRLFQGFFSGRGKAVMIVNVNKCSQVFDETLQVFKFSAIAKQVIIQQKPAKPPTITISPVLPVKPLTNMVRASIPWADDANNKARLNYSTCLSPADETINEDEVSDREKDLLDIIQKCQHAIAYLRDMLTKEKKERRMDEIRLRDEITKEMMKEFVAIEKSYGERIRANQILAEEMSDNRITKMLATVSRKKRPHNEMDSEDELVPISLLHESKNKIRECEMKIEQLNCRLNSSKIQMRRITTDNSVLATENTCLQFQVSDMLQVPKVLDSQPENTTNVADNLEQANVLSKLTSMLKTTQEKLKNKEFDVAELKEQLQEAGETFQQQQDQIDKLEELIKDLQTKPAECKVCKARSEDVWQLRTELQSQLNSETGSKKLTGTTTTLPSQAPAHLRRSNRSSATNNNLAGHQPKHGGHKRSPWFSCVSSKQRVSDEDGNHKTNNLKSSNLRGMVVEKADESRVLRVLLNNAKQLVPTPTKTSLLRTKRFPSTKDVNIENMSQVSKFSKGGKKKDSPKRRMLAPICTNLIADKKNKKEIIKNRRRSSLVYNKRLSMSKRYNLRNKK